MTTDRATIFEIARQSSWRTAAIALAIATLTLAILLLPGVLRKPALRSAVPLAGPSASDAERGRLLERQIAELERHLAQDVCRLDDQQLPRLQQIERRQSSVPGQQPGSERPGGPAGKQEGKAASVEPPAPYSTPVAPERARVPEGAAPQLPQTPANLAELLERATVLVVTPSGVGSGFFVSSTHALTNAHVVADATDVWIGNKTFDRLQQATVVARRSDGRPGGRDYALIALKRGQASAFLALAEMVPAKLQNVIAAGYPAFVMRSDAAFQRLLQGDPTGVPDLSLTQGAVQTVQQPEDALPIIVHRASISSGNSGGPLTDECGVAVGVNTFIAAPGEGTDRQYYSQGARSAIEFLRSNGVSPQIVSGRRCVTSVAPAAQQQAPVPTAPPTPRAEPQAPPSETSPPPAKQTR